MHRMLGRLVAAPKSLIGCRQPHPSGPPESIEPDGNGRAAPIPGALFPKEKLFGTDRRPAYRGPQRCGPIEFSGIIGRNHGERARSEEHTSELPSLMRISYVVFCLKKKT